MHKGNIDMTRSQPLGDGPATIGPSSRTVADALVETLIANDVDTVFGIPGVQTYELFDSFARHRDHIRVVGARHEQACGYMATGYAQASGSPGVFSVVPGPGVLNAGAALITALATSTPVVGLTSEIPTDYLGRGLGHLHETPDQLAMLRGMSKWAANVIDPDAAAATATEAFAQALSGRRGPAVVATPWDVLGHQSTSAVRAASIDSPPSIDRDALTHATEALRRARQPMILVGSGARDASAEIRALARIVQAPVVALRGGRGVVDNDDVLGFTCADGAAIWTDVDVVLAIGSRQELLWFRWPNRRDEVTIVNLDIDSRQQERLRPDIALTGDAREGVLSLLERIGDWVAPPREHRYELLRSEVRARIDERLQPHAEFLASIRAGLPRDGVLVEEASQIGFASIFGFPVHEPRQYLGSGYQGNLGSGFQIALGAKVARPQHEVLSVTGDGGFLYGIQELATAVQERIGTITVVFDNAAFGNVKADQLRLFGRSYGSDLISPDFVSLARSFGAESFLVRQPAELESRVRQARGRELPTVLVVPMPLDTAVSPWPFIMPPQPTVSS